LFDFACGGSAALFVFNKNKAIQWLQNFTTFQRNLFYLYLVVHFILFYFLNHFSAGITNQFIALINRYIFVIYIALFISRQVANNSQSTFLVKNRFLIFTGRISYGLYCFHGITITLINLLLLRFQIGNGFLVLIYFVGNYAIATISYFYLETPFLKLKQKWRRV
jgi:peptidoglycan/LPS O-acetylase OafA/YrhL